ncbi:MAG TPA: thaumatin family protein, partial [Myxococcota bacterium]|nr:thaumatin family protein [Myxococcota bacterium]
SGGGTLSQVQPQLASGASVQLTASADWSGRLWGRTGCTFDGDGAGACATGDCGGQLQCAVGGQSPATLAEFTFAGAGQQTFYDVSLVDGFNVPMQIEGGGASASCPVTGCPADVNAACPAGLERRDASGRVVGCSSACEALGTPEACCTGPYATPETCRPTPQAEHFKAQCPAAYSYAYDDPTSTFTCGGRSFVVTFCP